MPTVKDITQYLESIAHPSLQESYDNAGLLVGNPNWEVEGIMVCLDSIEEVIDEAIERDCNLVVAHHPIIFGGLKRLNGSNYIERVVMKAIKHDIAIYAIHTNLDNVRQGVNNRICDRIGLQNRRVLAPIKGHLKKLMVFVPKENIEEVSTALFDTGAGHIGDYSNASFRTEGTGTFKGNENTNPTIGQKGQVEKVAEYKLEVLYPTHLEGPVLKAMWQAHPYEEVAYDIITLDNRNQDIGAGMIGELAEAIDSRSFLTQLKEKLSTDCIRYTELVKHKVKKVAVCGGSGSFLLPQVKAAGADIFITADFKYHQFFDADGDIIIADVGHYESEQFTMHLLQQVLREKFTNFAVLLTTVNTNPVKYI